MAKFKKKPVVIDAMQWTGGNTDDVLLFCPIAKSLKSDPADIGQATYWLNIPTPEVNNQARIGDFIIKGVNGEFYPCKPDIFNMTYEPAE